MLQDLNQDGDERVEEIYKKDFFVRFFLLIQIFYSVRFFYRMTRYTKGQCPRGKMSSIGKYQRNILGLKSTFWAGVSGSLFPLIQNILRTVTEHALSRWHAFYANFIILDSLLYLFYISIFLVASLKDVPSVSDPPRKTTFYASRPTKLEPRRPKTQFKVSGLPPVPNSSSTQIVKREGFEEVQMMQKIVKSSFGGPQQHLVTIYRSPSSCGQKKGYQDEKIKNNRRAKLIKVREYAGEGSEKPKTSARQFIYLTKH